ncbi:serine proteinase stubble-like [Uloborus diversus]|uniref:serine proteinase stubble-like n=1 Tax=Uloborus diversus TaxID=327109 RepID=UPI002408F32F|nr:serine proteinase stubble-like [Uloborus diversus]
MRCSDWLTKRSICLLCVVTLLCSDVEGRSYEKCTAEDGRLGYCVAIIYCRQGQSQRLLRCEGDDNNYCCPLPTTQATEKPRRHITERPRRPIFGDEERGRPSVHRYDPELDGKPFDERPRRPTNDRTPWDDEDRRRSSRPGYDDELDGKPVDERPKRPTGDRTPWDDEDRRRPSRPRYDEELDGKPVDERPRRPSSDRTPLDDEDRRRPSRPRYDEELDGKPVDERPRRPSSDRTPLGGEDRNRPSRPGYDPDLDGKSVNERPRRPPSDRTPLGGEDRSRPSRPGYDPDQDGKRVDERPRRLPNDRTPTGGEDRRRPSRPGYDTELDGKPVDERPRRPPKRGTDENRDRTPETRYDSEPDDEDPAYFPRPRDVEKPRDAFGDSNGQSRDSSGRFPDPSRSLRPEMPSRPEDTRGPSDRTPPRRDSNEPRRPEMPSRPEDTRGPSDRTPPRRDSPEPRRPEQPYRPAPGDSNDYDPGPDHRDDRRPQRPKDATGPTDHDGRGGGPVIRFPDRRNDRRNGYGERGDTPGTRMEEDPKDFKRGGEEDRQRPRSENKPRREDRPPLRGAEEASKSNATVNRAPDARAPQLPKIPGCGVRPYKLFIAGGEQSEEHQWPWMAAIFRRFPDSRPKAFLCGGSLINTRFILTAAHCFVNNYVILPASAFVVRLGSNSLSSGEEYTVAKLVLHHNHSGSDYFNDIALIRLAGEAFVTDKIAPICLPTHQMALMDMVGLTATVAGWGDVEYRTSGTRVLQHVTIPIVSNQECSAAYSRVRGAAFLARGSDHVMCAGLKEGGKDACLGDSGGPLMLQINEEQWVVVGVVSLGYKCAEPGYYGVYTRVTHYTSWIDGHLRQRH